MHVILHCASPGVPITIQTFIPNPSALLGVFTKQKSTARCPIYQNDTLYFDGGSWARLVRTSAQPLTYVAMGQKDTILAVGAGIWLEGKTRGAEIYLPVK